MKKWHFLIVVLCFLAFNFSAVAEVKKMTFVCEDKEDFPSLIGNKAELEKVKPGVAVEVLHAVGKKLGINIVVNRVPWKRALELELNNNKVDGLFLASYKKEREAFGAYPMKDGQVDKNRKFSTVTYVFYKLKNSEVKYDGNELKNFNGKIGSPRGYSIVEDLQKKGYTVDESDSTLTDMKKLSLGRVGVVVALELTGDHILEKNPNLSNVIEKITTPLTTKGYYFMLSHQFVKDNPALAEKFWTEIADTSEKNYKNLVNKYLD